VVPRAAARSQSRRVWAGHAPGREWQRGRFHDHFGGIAARAATYRFAAGSRGPARVTASAVLRAAAPIRRASPPPLWTAGGPAPFLFRGAARRPRPAAAAGGSRRNR